MLIFFQYVYQQQYNAAFYWLILFITYIFIYFKSTEKHMELSKKTNCWTYKEYFWTTHKISKCRNEKSEPSRKSRKQISLSQIEQIHVNIVICFFQMNTSFSMMTIIHMSKLRKIYIKGKNKWYNRKYHRGNDMHCKPVTSELEFRNDVGSIQVGGNRLSISG